MTAHTQHDRSVRTLDPERLADHADQLIRIARDARFGRGAVLLTRWPGSEAGVMADVGLALASDDEEQRARAPVRTVIRTLAEHGRAK